MAAQGPARHRPRVFAVLHEPFAGDNQKLLVAAAALHESTGASGEVVLVLRRFHRQVVEVDDVDVGIGALAL